MKLHGLVCLGAACMGLAVVVAGARPSDAPASRQKVFAIADVGQHPGDRDVVAFDVQRVPSPVVALRVVFFGVTASVRRSDLGRRLGGAEMGAFKADLRAPNKRPASGIAVLVNDGNMRVSLKLGSNPEITFRASRPGASAETKPGYGGMDLSLTTKAGRLVLAPKHGCTRSGARFDATLQDGSHIKKTFWVGCA